MSITASVYRTRDDCLVCNKPGSHLVQEHPKRGPLHSARLKAVMCQEHAARSVACGILLRPNTELLRLPPTPPTPTAKTNPTPLPSPQKRLAKLARWGDMYDAPAPPPASLQVVYLITAIPHALYSPTQPCEREEWLGDKDCPIPACYELHTTSFNEDRYATKQERQPQHGLFRVCQHCAHEAQARKGQLLRA